MAKSINKTKKTKKAVTTKDAKQKIVHKINLKGKKFDEQIFDERLHKYYDELKWLYCELYQEDKTTLAFFADLLKLVRSYAEARADYLRGMDELRANDLAWYQDKAFVGMELYPECFAGDLKNFVKRLPYLEESKVKYVHLLDVFDYSGAVNKDLGSTKDLIKLVEKCHEQNLSVCLDAVLNATSSEYEWAVRSLHGEKTYQETYCLFDTEDVAKSYLSTATNIYEITYLPKIEKYALTTNQGKNWELNYHNPAVLNKMLENLLAVANLGADIISLQGITQLWKAQGMDEAWLPQNHNIVRIARIVCEIACPAVILLGEVNMPQEKAITYFGSAQHGQCHILRNASGTAELWHSLATRDTALLKHSIDVLAAVPKAANAIWQNNLRQLNGIKWNLDYAFLASQGIDEALHRQYLNQFFVGEFANSFAAGKLCSCGDAETNKHLCGTTASLCGIEYYDKQKDKDDIARAIDCDLMLHGTLLSLSGVPTLCSGDEIAQYSDCDYQKNAHKKNNAHYMNKAIFNWRKAGRRTMEKAIQAKVYQGLQKLLELRSKYAVFSASADVYTLPTWDKAVLAVVRETADEKFIGLYNFSETEHTGWIKDEGLYTDLCTEATEVKAVDIKLQPYQMMWLWRSKK